ncbi:MAG TPA: RES family NAD+ phosphorylase [Allosphingosinicella sp.]|nr:RES family NAD+ phosphorylase [Allosphingosinicella sp.]
MIPSPPDPFPAVNRRPLAAGSEIHRIHDSGFAANAFNPGKGRPSRFAPLIRADGTAIPTGYAADGHECAAHETVFHEVQHDAPRKTIPFLAIEPLSHAVLLTRRELVLASLFEPDLNSWGLTRGQMIDTLADSYPDTARWALALHERWPDVDGLVWTSRRCDPRQAYLLFGDRVAEDDLEPIAETRIVASNDALAALRRFGARAGITIVL